MWGRIMDIIRQRGLMEKVESETRKMLQLSQQMFQASTKTLLEQKDIEFNLYTQDQKINNLLVNVRKKIIEHLAISHAQNIDAEILFIKVVADIERIGDYSKNLLEVRQAFHTPLSPSDYLKKIQTMYPLVIEAFPNTEAALFECAKDAAEKVLNNHHLMVQTCDNMLTDLLTDESLRGPEGIALALTARYFKRVSSHLKNVASTAVTPFHHMGYTKTISSE